MSILDLYAGVEELDLDGVADEVSEAVEEVVKTEIAEVAVAVEEQSAQIEELVEAVEELEEASEEVVEVVEGLESLLGSGNYNSTAFAYQYNRAAKLSAKLGGRSASRLGAESLGDASTAQLMAREGIEGFMETVKDWGKKAAEFIKHIFNTVINFFVSIFSSVAAIEKRADQLKKRIEDAKELKKDIKLGGWNAYFDYKKNGLTTNGMPTSPVAVEDMINVVKNPTSVTVADFSSAYATAIAAIKADGAGFKANKKVADGEEVLIGQIAALRFKASYKAAGKFDKLSDCVEAARSIKVRVMVDSAEAKKIATGETKATIDRAGLLKEVGSVQDAAKIIRAGKVEQKFSKAERDRVVGLLNAVKPSDDKAAAGETGDQIKLVRAVFATGASVVQSGIKLITTVCKAKLDGVAAHI